MTGVQHARGSNQVEKPRRAPSDHDGEEGRGAHPEVYESEGQLQLCFTLVALFQKPSIIVFAQERACVRERERDRGGRESGDRQERITVTLSHAFTAGLYSIH